MGIYLNPGNSGFQEIVQSDYVDKTGLIALINQKICKAGKLFCVSRPRRFGKSYAAKMLCAYYDCSCDSDDLFRNLEVAETDGYQEHLNAYNVISLDVTSFISRAKRRSATLKTIPDDIVNALHGELRKKYPDAPKEQGLTEDLIWCAEKTGRKFVFIIDEWDALIREAKDDDDLQTAYLNMLREWFKNNSFTPKVVAAAYLTGILPIKKDGTQSAISDFDEYTILWPGPFAKYTGLSESEVRGLCETGKLDFNEVKAWYDGYEFSGVEPIYNPYSVMSSIRFGECRSYWRKTSAAESLMTYVGMDYDGLQEIIMRLITGEEVPVDVEGFENDFESFGGRDDVLTLLIHLGYLTWNGKNGLAKIPNEEVRREFRKILKGGRDVRGFATLLSQSQKLLKDTIDGNADEVAATIQKIRDSEYAPTFYNDEQALRYVIKFAYIAALEQYARVEELPSGRGIADVVFIPKNAGKPALVIELKWNKSSNGALEQIKANNYPAALREFTGEIIMVGINYDEKTKVHGCSIETI